MPDVSLLTEDVRALIGTTTELGSATVTQRLVERAVETYTGRQTRTYAPGEAVPGYVLSALDGSDDSPEMPRLLPQSILISNEWQFERPLRMGETFTLVYRLANIAERFGGKFGYSLDFRTECDFVDAEGSLVARTVQSMMQYDASEASDGGEP